MWILVGKLAENCDSVQHPREILFNMIKNLAKKKHEKGKWLPRLARVTRFHVVSWQWQLQNTVNSRYVIRAWKTRECFLRGRNWRRSLVHVEVFTNPAQYIYIYVYIYICIYIYIYIHQFVFNSSPMVQQRGQASVRTQPPGRSLPTGLKLIIGFGGSSWSRGQILCGFP